MVSFNPKERPTIQDILYESEWMKEIRDMKPEQLNELEKEVKQELMKREEKIEDSQNNKKEVNNQKLDKNENKNEGNKEINDEDEDEDDNLFDINLKPKYAFTGKNMKNYIKIKGKMNPVKFMNNLVNEINNKLCDICVIDNPYEYKLKFDIIFSNQENDIDLPDDLVEEIKKLGNEFDYEYNENENIKGKQCIIQVTLFESYNGGYLLRFNKRDGNQIDFFENIKKIYSIIQNII